ncbi:MAG: hypothetical protein AB1778_07715 [Candidatus Bipolaricaulota bacterium]
MARRAIVVAWLVVVVSAFGFAAELPSSYVYWSSARPLSWADFCAAPPANVAQTNWVASPSLHLEWTASFSATGARSAWTAQVTTLNVTNAMDTARSWVLASRATPSTLHHEQLHFDLNEVYRRLLEMTLRPLTACAASPEVALQSLRDALNSASVSILTRVEQAQAQFDRDTAHGTNLAAQAIWEERIAVALVNPLLAP